MRERQELSTAALAAVSVVAAGAMVALGRASAGRRTAELDERARTVTAPPRRHPVRRAARELAPIGKWYTYLPIAVASGMWLMRRGDDARARADGAAVIASGLAAFAVGKVYDRWAPQPPAPPGQDDPTKPVYPSGHAMGTAAVALSLAHALSRGRLADPRVAFPIAAALPLATAGTRLVDEKHWISDVVGGYLGGVAIAAACAAASTAAQATADVTRERTPSPVRSRA